LWLSIKDPFPSSNTISSKVVIGSTIGSVIFGALVGFLFSFYWNRRRRLQVVVEKGKEKEAGTISSPRASRFTVEPYPAPVPEDAQSGTAGEESMQMSTTPKSTINLNSPRSDIARQTSTGSMQQQVYLVHHDGGRPPISVYTHEGANVVELPPSYGLRTPIEGPAGQTSLSQRLDSTGDSVKRQDTSEG
jgi:hypothetical protein